ncbi:MAG: hypothetical protein WCO13_13025 [Bacteroidota bacterium]
MNFKIKIQASVWQHLMIIGLFLLMVVIYFSPVIEGKSIQQSDMVNVTGMMKELSDYHVKTGEYTLWTTSMFGGMPAFQIMGEASRNVFSYCFNLLSFFGFLPYLNMAIIFTYLICAYFLFISLKVNKWIAFLGAIIIAFGSYNFIIISVGHITKAYAIAFIPLVIAGILLVYKRKYLWGGLLTALSLGCEVASNHPQITYYLALMIMLLVVIMSIQYIYEKNYKHFAISSSILLLSVFLAVLPHSRDLFITYEYAEDSIRGKSELTDNMGNKTSGLDKDYATAWSYGIGETMNLLIPNLMGGSSGGALPESSETYKFLVQNNAPNAKKIITQLPLYWGPQPFTEGPCYLGAITIFLFVLGIFIVKGSVKWWLLGCVVFSFMLAWGKNFFLTDLFLDYFPLYNKFRTVSMILVIAGICIPFLGILALDKILKQEITKAEFIKAFKWSSIIVGGVLMLFILFSSSFFNFTSPSDAQLPDWLKGTLPTDRESLLRSDAIRSLIFIALAGISIYFYFTKKLGQKYFLGILAVLVLADMWMVDKRYLNADNFISKRETANLISPTQADLYILQDKDLDYRVLNLTKNPFNESHTSYFHKSIGGYHAAKLRRYQDLVDRSIQPEIASLQSVFKNSVSYASIDSALAKLKILNMLNAKYIIVNPDGQPILNKSALGYAWFVKNTKLVENADEEIAGLKDFDPRTTAIVDKKYASLLTDLPATNDTSLSKASIELIKIRPDYISYQCKTGQKLLAVFSEVYYNSGKGWNMYIDGKKEAHLRANYVLRAAVIPAGVHNVEFRFEPSTYYRAQSVSLFGSILFILLAISGIIYSNFMKKKE